MATMDEVGEGPGGLGVGEVRGRRRRASQPLSLVVWGWLRIGFSVDFNREWLKSSVSAFQVVVVGKCEGNKTKAKTQLIVLIDDATMRCLAGDAVAARPPRLSCPSRGKCDVG